MARAVVIAVIVEVDAVAAAAVANRDTEQYHRVSREGRNSLFTEKTWFSRDKAKRADTGYRVRA